MVQSVAVAQTPKPRARALRTDTRANNVSNDLNRITT